MLWSVAASAMNDITVEEREDQREVKNPNPRCVFSSVQYRFSNYSCQMIFEVFKMRPKTPASSPLRVILVQFSLRHKSFIIDLTIGWNEIKLQDFIGLIWWIHDPATHFLSWSSSFGCLPVELQTTLCVWWVGSTPKWSPAQSQGTSRQNDHSQWPNCMNFNVALSL